MGLEIEVSGYRLAAIHVKGGLQLFGLQIVKKVGTVIPDQLVSISRTALINTFNI